jgi:phosphoribosylformimino-5-aminoimidazole carboxamide ribotide isomerase
MKLTKRLLTLLLAAFMVAVCFVPSLAVSRQYTSYAVLGDSIPTGYMMPGYQYAGRKKVLWPVVPNSYPTFVAKGVGAKHTYMLAHSGYRTSDLRRVLDPDYVGDYFNARRLPKLPDTYAVDQAGLEKLRKGVIKYIAKNSKVPVQVGGGIRKESTIRKLLDAGVDRVIIGTRGVTDREWFREMAMTFPDKLILALDTKGGNITVKGWQEASSMTLSWMLTAVQDLPIYGILNTNIDVEGQGKGIDEAWIEKFTSMCNHRVIASGGVTTEEDAKVLAKYGVDSAVVGVSIYTGLAEPWNWSTPWEA